MAKIENYDRILYDRRAAAYALCLSLRTIDALLATKKLAFKKVGRKTLIHRDELLRFASQNHYGPIGAQQISR